MNKTENTSVALLITVVLLVAATFFLDLRLPLGVAGGVPYVGAVLVSLWFPQRRYTWYVAVICSALTILGYFLSPQMGVLKWVVRANRFLALAAIWATAILGLQRKKVIIMLSERTRDLEISQNNLKDLSQRLIKAQETEREWIAREIHDDLGQSLVTSKILIQSINSEINSTNPALKKSCQTIIEYHDTIIDKIHNISSTLRPPTLREFGLTKAIKLMVDEFNQSKDVRVKLNSCKLENLEFQGEQINLYRIIQEALTNMVKHAQASETKITIKKKNGRLQVTIEDNGRGISLTKKEKLGKNLGGIGLSTMEERAMILGGELRVTNNDGQGTTVALDIPIKNHTKENE